MGGELGDTLLLIHSSTHGWVGGWVGGLIDLIFTLVRRASDWAASWLTRCFSDLSLWMDSMSTRLFLNWLPFTL